MTESLKLSAEARADWNKKQQHIKDEQQARVDATVDEWMKDEGTVENALLEAVNEVSGDMAILIVEAKKAADEGNPIWAYIIERSLMRLLKAQFRKQMREDVEVKLYE